MVVIVTISLGGCGWEILLSSVIPIIMDELIIILLIIINFSASLIIIVRKCFLLHFIMNINVIERKITLFSEIS